MSGENGDAVGRADPKVGENRRIRRAVPASDLLEDGETVHNAFFDRDFSRGST
jgi:hypothetical protein